VTSGLEPVAWVVFASDGSDAATTCLNRDVAEVIAELHGWQVAPLYRQPTLTDAEREAIEGAMWDYGQYADEMGLSVAEVVERQVTLRGLLERMK